MAGFFKSATQNQGVDERTLLENKYSTSRHNLLIVIAFTAINIVLLAMGGESYFLFSAYIPYVLVGVGMDLCGMFPEEYYDLPYGAYDFYDKSLFAILLAVAIVMLAVYLLCWIFSKKNRVGWMIFALVWFGIDSAMLLLMMAGDISTYLLDIVFHVWVVVSLISGIRAHYKLENLPVEEPESWPVIPEQPAEEACEPVEPVAQTEE